LPFLSDHALREKLATQLDLPTSVVSSQFDKTISDLSARQKRRQNKPNKDNLKLPLQHASVEKPLQDSIHPTPLRPDVASANIIPLPSLRIAASESVLDASKPPSAAHSSQARAWNEADVKSWIKLWNEADVKSWIKLIGSGAAWAQYAEYLHENGVDGVTLLSITEGDLVKFGVKEHHARTIIEQRRELLCGGTGVQNSFLRATNNNPSVAGGAGAEPLKNAQPFGFLPSSKFRTQPLNVPEFQPAVPALASLDVPRSQMSVTSLSVAAVPSNGSVETTPVDATLDAVPTALSTEFSI